MKREVTKVESYIEEMGGELLLQLGSAQLTVPTNINPHWVATVMKALAE
ncbi:hypothetical protein [Alteromonas gracilis]